MEFKRISAAGLALTLLGGMTSALAAGLPEGAAPYGRPQASRYVARVAVNGTQLESVTFENTDPETYEGIEVTLNMADLPAAPAGYVPARMVCAADTANGYTYWSTEDNAAVFSLHKSTFTVYFDDLRIELEGETVEGESAYLSEGVTFLPLTFLATLPNVEVDDHPEMDSWYYDITLVVTPLEALANTIREEAGAAAHFEYDLEMLGQSLEIPTGDIEALVAYGPMMTNPDTVFIVKAPADKHEPIIEGFEAYRQRQIDTFSWYLTGQLPKAQNGQVVSEGDYVMLFIGEDSEKAVELFRTGVKALTEAE